MNDETKRLEKIIEQGRHSDIIDRRYAYYKRSREEYSSYLVYVIEVSHSCDFGVARIISRRETLLLRDGDGYLSAGVRSNSYFCKDGERKYIVGLLCGSRNQIKRMVNSLRENSFEEISLPKEVVIPICRTTEDQRTAVLPLVQPDSLPVPYQNLLAYLK